MTCLPARLFLPLVPGKLRPNPSCRAKEDQLPGRGGDCGLNVSAAARGDLGTEERGEAIRFLKAMDDPNVCSCGQNSLVTLSLKPEAWLGVPFLLGAQNELCPLKDGCSGQESQSGHTCVCSLTGSSRAQSHPRESSHYPSLRVRRDARCCPVSIPDPLLSRKPLSEETPLDFWLPSSFSLSKALMNPSNPGERT